MSSWELDHHAAAARRRVLGADRAAVQLDDPPRDREAEAGAAARARRVRTVEALEDAAAVARRDPGPLVDHPELDAPSARDRTDDDLAAVGRVPDGVGDEVPQHLLHPLVVGVELERLGVDDDGDTQPPLLRLLPPLLD